MITSPNALELFESSVKESLCFFCCFFVCQFVCLLVCFWLLLSSFVTFFANRKEEEWHMATRGNYDI